MSVIPTLRAWWRRATGRMDRGAAMVVTVTLVALCATASMVVASSTIFGTTQTATDRSHLQALAAAEAGRDALLAQLETSPTSCPASRTASGTIGAASYTATAAWAATISGAAGSVCPADGTIRITATGTAGGVTKTVVAYYPFRAGGFVTGTATATSTVTATTTTTTTATVPTVRGAILEGGGAAMNVPTVVVNGDVVLGAGSFDCNGASVIDGDLVVPRGSVDLSNTCKVTGSIIASGNIYVHNLTNQVGRDVVSTGGTVKIEGASVGGSVMADGGVQLNNSVQVGGDVIARGNGATVCNGSNATGSSFTGSSSSPVKTVGGSVKIGGILCQVDLLKVTGSITATGAGTTSIGGVGAVSASAIKLAGDCRPCAATPAPVTGASGLPVAGFTNPAQIGYATWLEIPWTSNSPSWTSAGWTVTTATANDCDYQNNANLVTAINNLTVPTVIDATACGTNGPKLYGVTFNLKTNVTFIAKSFNNAQSLTVNTSAPGSARTFNLIVPDPTPGDNAPTCPSDYVNSTIYGAKLGTGVSGLAYSPCTLAIGTVTWTGQLIAGYPDPAGGNATVTYQQAPVPGATASGGTATATLTALATATTTATVTTTTTTSQSVSPSLTPTLLQQKEQ